MERRIKRALAATLLALTATAGAGTVTITGTRTNISPGGIGGDRCAPAITVRFAPDAFAAHGVSELGAFNYTASHCIASPPPGSYFDGLFEWVFADGTLFGTHSGELTASGTAGVFNVFESLVFTGGSGRFLGATGTGSATGTVRLGVFDGQFASFGDAAFMAVLSGRSIPEPGTLALFAAAAVAAGGIRLRRRGAPDGGPDRHAARARDLGAGWKDRDR